MLVAFFITPFLVKYLGKETYSFYPIANNIIGYFTIIVTALNSMASRFITIELVKERIEIACQYYSSVFFANLALVGFLLIPMAFIVGYLEQILDVPSESLLDIKIMFTLVFASMLINVATSVFDVATFAKDRIDLRSGVQISISLIRVILYLLLFTVFRPSIIFVGVVAVVETITKCIMQAILTLRLLPDFRISCSAFHIGNVKQLVSAGVWNSINSLGSSLLLSMSLVLANLLIGASASGELSIVQTLTHFCTTIISMLVTVFVPRLTRQYALDDALIVSEAKNSQKIMGTVTTIPILLACIFGIDFYRLWMPNENFIRLQMLSVISMIPLVIQANMWTLTSLHVVLNIVRIPSIVTLGLGILNVFLCYTGIALFPGRVEVIPIVTTILNCLYCLVFVPIYVSINMKLQYKTFYSHIARAGVAIMLILLIEIPLRNYISVDSWLQFFSYGMVFGIIGLLIYIPVACGRRFTHNLFIGNSLKNGNKDTFR